MRVICVCMSPALDATVRMSAWPADGSIAKDVDEVENVGGKGINVARWLARRGVDVACGGLLGADNAGPFERELARKSRLPGWYPKVEKVARKCGIELQDESGAMGGALLLIAVVVIPLIAAVRLLLVFLNQYCLSWAAMRVVMDLRVDLLRQVQHQSLQFHGRIDVGQLLMRSAADPMAVQHIIQSMLAEVARAPFEIFAAVAFADKRIAQ